MIARALGWLEQEEGLILPFGFPVGSYRGGVRPIISEAEWDAYDWNPPADLSFSDPDPEASPKPTWAELIEAAGHAERDDLVTLHIEALRQECRTRITKAYGESSIEEEILKRLGDAPVAAGDQSRRLMIWRFRELRLWLEVGASLTDLSGFDATDDTHWPGGET